MSLLNGMYKRTPQGEIELLTTEQHAQLDNERVEAWRLGIPEGIERITELCGKYRGTDAEAELLRTQSAMEWCAAYNTELFRG